MLGRVAASELTTARLQIHWAAQILSAVGDAVVERREDDSHSNLEYLVANRCFAGHPATEPPQTRAALRPHDLTLLILGERGEPAASYELAGRRMEEGLAWMSNSLEAMRGAPAPLELRGYEMPSHPVGEGAPFELAPAPAFADAAAWYASGDRILRRLADRRREASPVRCWPHHFDLATLLLLEPHEDPEQVKSVGVGMLLGDDSYGEPYWYVSPWPEPDEPKTPPLAAGGHWHREGFFAAVLTASQIVAAGSATEQERAVESFLASALDALAPSS